MNLSSKVANVGGYQYQSLRGCCLCVRDGSTSGDFKDILSVMTFKNLNSINPIKKNHTNQYPSSIFNKLTN